MSMSSKSEWMHDDILLNFASNFEHLCKYQISIQKPVSPLAMSRIEGNLPSEFARIWPAVTSKNTPATLGVLSIRHEAVVDTSKSQQGSTYGVGDVVKTKPERSFPPAGKREREKLWFEQRQMLYLWIYRYWHNEFVKQEFWSMLNRRLWKPHLRAKQNGLSSSFQWKFQPLGNSSLSASIAQA